MADTIFDLKPGDLAILDYIDPAFIGTTRISPGNSIMAHGSPTRLPDCALNGKAGIVEIKERAFFTNAVAIKNHRIGTRQAHCVAPSYKGIPLRIAVDQVQNAALADHGVIVEILLQPFPQFQRQFVKGLIALKKIVGPDNRCVAADIA
jgi:hypothetical protein